MALNVTHSREKMSVIGTNRLTREQNSAGDDSKLIQNEMLNLFNKLHSAIKEAQQFIIM